VWLDRAWWPSWSVTVDGEPVAPVRGLGGMLAPVTAGRHEVSATLQPTEASLGAGIGLLVAVVATFWAVRPVRGGRPTASISPSARRRP
jgi:hypothetical protein